MIDATPSRVRMHDLDALGRYRPAESGGAGLHRPSAARRPSTPSSRSGTDDFVASTILAA
jgi:hypothetical protein